jgi:hypothetical protein
LAAVRRHLPDWPGTSTTVNPGLDAIDSSPPLSVLNHSGLTDLPLTNRSRGIGLAADRYTLGATYLT